MSRIACKVFTLCSKHGNLSAASNLRMLTRGFSSYDERKYPYQSIDVDTVSQDSSFNWPDTRLGLLEPTDNRFPLPGLIGTPRPVRPKIQRFPRTTRALGPNSDVITAELPYERHSSVFEQFVTVSQELARKNESGDSINSPFDVLDCLAQECPFFLLKDFRVLFPNIDVSSYQVTLITLHEKENFNRTTEDAGVKRIHLVEQFISAANDLCRSLHSAGYWADFIDPTSGMPYLASNTALSLYEKDYQYKQLGFEITSFTGCRLVVHHPLGTRPYVGCIFTRAPLDHPLIVGLTEVKRTDEPSSAA